MTDILGKIKTVSDVGGEYLHIHAVVQPFKNMAAVSGVTPTGADEAIRVDATDKKSTKTRFRRHHKALRVRVISAIVSLTLAMLGIAMMIVLNEVTYSVASQDDAQLAAQILRSLLVISSAALVVSIIVYHMADMQVMMFNYGIEDWRILPSRRRLSIIIFECFICAICPIPGNYFFFWWVVHQDGATITHAATPVDILLSIPMFLRLYLVPRVLLLANPLFARASSQLLAALNRIRFNFPFVLKTLMTLYPAPTLGLVLVLYWPSSAYIVQLCERYHNYDERHNVTLYDADRFKDYFNDLWVIAVTFLTIGYGDIVPNTYCGRAVAIVTGAVGICSTAFVINAVSTRMQLSPAEKRIFQIMDNSDVEIKIRHAAKNVVAQAWLIHKYRRLCTSNKKAMKKYISVLRRHQAAFVRVLDEFRTLKRQQRVISGADEEPNLEALFGKSNSALLELRKFLTTKLEEIYLEQREIRADVESLQDALKMSACRCQDSATTQHKRVQQNELFDPNAPQPHVVETKEHRPVSVSFSEPTSSSSVMDIT